MKKFVIALTLAGLLTGLSSCNNKNTTTATDINDTASAQETVITEDAAVTERDSFEVLPEEANSSFNTVIEAAKDAIPLEKGFKRQYGYKGTAKINGENCYIFSVYDFNDDNVSTKAGEFAKSINSDKLFLFNNISSAYEELELTSSVQSWSVNDAVKQLETKMKGATRLAAESLKA